MNAIPLHPALVHLPVGLGIVLPLIDLFLAWAIWRAWVTRKAWLLAIGLHAIVAVGAFAAVNTGDHEGERVEHRVPKAALEEHEELGETTLGFALGALALAIGAGLVKPGVLHKSALALTCAGAVATAGLAIATGHAGGKLVYLHGAGTSPETPAPPPPTERDVD